MHFLRGRRVKRFLLYGFTALVLTYLILKLFYLYNVQYGEHFGELDFKESINEELLIEDDFHNIPAHHADVKDIKQELISKALYDIQNLPQDPNFILGELPDGPKHISNSNCAKFPYLYNINFNNLYWQVEKIGSVTFYLYRAYYDNRKPNNNFPLVRILAMVDQPELKGDSVCQLWFKNKRTPVFAPVRLYRNIWQAHWSKHGLYNAFLITCQIPKSHAKEVPESVSLVEKKCDNARNNLRVFHDTSVTEADRINRFGVCVKGLDLIHDDKSTRLIEWIELLNILGADKIFFYEFAVHENVKRVLEYYSNRGIVDKTQLTLPGTLPNEPFLRHLFLGNKENLPNKRKNEVIPYNDCLYRNLNNYEFLAVLDTDEVIIPKVGYSWRDLINHPNVQTQNSSNDKPISTFCFRNSYFFDGMTENRNEEEFAQTDGISQNFHMLKHIYRSAIYTPPKKFIKCFHKTEKTVMIHNHFPFGCLEGSCNIHHFDTDISHMQHYRSTCVDDLGSCKEYEANSIRDTTIWRYKDELIERVTKAFSEIEFV